MQKKYLIGYVFFSLVGSFIVINAAQSASESKNTNIDSMIRIINKKEYSREKKIEAIKKIATLNSNKAIDVIIKEATQNDDKFVRRECVNEALKLYKNKKISKEIMFSLMRKIANDHFAELRETASQTIAKLGGPNAAELIISILNAEFEKEVKLRGLMSPRTRSFREQDSVINRCIQDLIRLGEYPFPAARKSPISTTKQSVIPSIKYFLAKNKVKDMDYCLAHVLYKLKHKPYLIDEMIEGIDKSSSKTVKIKIIYDLAEIGDKRAIPSLEKAFENNYKIKAKDGKTYYPIKIAAKYALSKFKK